ncbi:WXG100-like domain-containing protein, partial [Amycolatopsis oliviviridis]
MSSGVHIPADVRRFLEFTLGLSWPESDDQGLVALWKAWEAFEDAAGVFEAASRAAGTAVPEVLEGATGEFFARFLSTTISDGVAGLRESSGELGRMAQNAAADVYKTKVMFVVFAAFTLASVLHLLATLIGALFTGVVIAAARVALTAIWKALVTRLGQLSITGGLSQATKAALLKAAKDLALKTGGFAAFGAALMGGTDFGVQARQIADGDRDGWDIRSLTSSLVGGALGGAFAGVFHSAAGGIRRIAFDLRDGLASREPGGLFADGVTIGQVTTALDGPLSALGDLVYATGQMITVIATAPLINLALGAPAGNPALGALGALSRYGGGRRGGSSGGGTLDSVHPPVLPDFSIPAKDEPDTKADPATEKPTSPKKPATGETGHGPEKAELPPPYLATAEGADLRAEKTPAYTTSPHVLGSLYTTTPIAPAVAAPTPGSVPAAAPAVTTAAVPAPAMTSAPAGIPASAAPVSPAAVTAGHSPATAAFLAGSAPPSLPEAAHTSAGQDAPRPLRTVALPGRGGVAFVSDLHAGNVRAAFPEPTPGVYRVVVESGDDDTFILPGHDDLATSAPRHHLVTALAGLPPRLATWNRDTTIELLSCYLTPTDHTHLSPLLHASLGTTTLTFPHVGTPLTVHANGDVRTIDTSPESDESVLHLGPKRKRGTPLGALDPETQRQLAIAATEALHQHGSLDAQQLSPLVSRESLPQKVEATSVKAAVSAARERLRASGQLWTPHYAGASRSGRFDLAEPDELTVWLWWQAASRPEVSAQELAREAVLAGFTSYAEMPAFAREAIDAAVQDGRRHRPGDPSHGAAALGRLLEAGVASDRDLIKKIIHAMAWSDKTATAEELAARLLTEAVVTGSAAELETLARGVVGNADRAGDRLVQLSVTDPAQAPAAMDRALGIVSGTPRLREPERLSELVKHLRIRHITGPQRAVEEFAARVRQEGITAPAGVQEHQRTSLEPLTLRERMLDVAERDDRAAIDELALKVVSALGNTDRSTLVATLVNKGVKKESVRWEVLDRALEQARTEGWLWHPIHAGREGRAYGHLEGFTPEEPTRLTAFLWLQAITHPTESSLELAHRAYRAGFTDNEELRVAVELALAAAVRDGRRYPDLMISDPAHRDGIRTLISALVAHRDPAKPPESVLSFRRTLRDYNIRGGRSELDKEIAYARRESDLSANAVTKPGVPELSLERKFAGRVLDANALADHSSIRALAYAAATMYKSAASDRLRQVLGHAGVITRADPAAESDLRLLIEDAAAEATANGDRLETLTITDEADRELVLARAVGVLRSAPELHARGDVAEVVAHLRMRHISGPHTALENLGRGLLSTPFDNLSAPGTVPHFAPVVRAHKPSFTNPADQPALIESARKLVEQHGGLDSETLRVRLTRTNAERTGTYPTASIAKQQADDEGWLWSPTYRGVTKLDDEGHRQAMLWQLAVDRPRATASDILQLAEQAGLARTRDMPALAREAVTAAVADQRRHPLLHITTDEHKPQVHALIDAVLLTEPELGVEATVLRLYEHNLRGTRERVRKAVRDRQAAPAEHPPDETRKLAAANTLTLNRKGTFYGRTLRSDVPEDRVTIEKLAYAVVWAHKTDTPSELARRLEDNGVIAEPDALAGIVTSAIRLADHHGDRLQRLSADLPTHREAIRRRTLDIAIAQPDSRGLSTPDLVRLMRQRNITGSRNHLRQDADTVRALLARPTPHAATGTELGVPVDFGGHEVRVIPRRHGAGFVTESFGRHILNARVPEQEGVFDLFAAQRNDYYFLPGYRSGVVPSTPDRFLAGLAGLPAQLVAWSAVKEIRLWACDLDTRHVTHLNRLVLDPAFAVLGHVTITAARPGEPILIAPDGRIHTADDGTLPADTLHLGRKRKIDETSDARTGSGVADAATKKKVIDTAKALFHDFGNVSVDGLAPLTRQQGVEALKRDDYRKLTGQAKQELEASDDLWTPVYRGASRRGVFDPERPDELTTWLFWQVSSSPDAGGPDLAMTAQKAGFTNSRTELHGYARQAAKIVEDDRLRLGLGADDRIPAFLGRSWDVEVDSDRRVLAKIAYAAAWSDKTADAEALTDLLSSRGVTGPREKLLTLVTAVTEEATRNGDRLGPLSVADPAQQAELVDRALGIVFGTPGLREPARLGEFVKHLRTRHVNGSQEDLRRFAADVQGIPDLPSEPQFVPGRSLLPLTLRGVRLASSDAVELKTVEDLARRIVVEEGLRGRRTVLMNQLAREIGARETGLDAVISRAVERVKNEGLAWHPVHRGHEAREYRHRRGFSPAEPTELTAFLWLLVVDHPRSTATEIVRRAEDAGFADSDELHLAVTQAMVAAVRERRRHPTLSLARPEHRPAIDTLIAGLHAAAPEASDVEIQRRLRSYNVAGQAKSLNLAIKDGRTAPGTPAALPVLRSGGTFAGRALDIDVLTDVEAIARLAYAAACADKTADVGKLVHRLAREGVTGSHEALTRLVTDATTEAARNGDRLETLSITDIADEDAIRSRVLGILHSEPALRVPDRLYDLVTHLRMRHITGPHQVMEDLARDLRDKAPAQRGEPPFAPIRRLYGFVSATIPKQRVDELAREVVAEHGALSVGTLADYLEAEGISSAERTRAIMRAVQRAKDEGSLWFPTYRGIAENSDAGHLDAVLWQLVIDHPRLGPLEIARLTEHAGFAPTRTRRREAELAIAAAEKDRRRHPLLQVADHATDARVNELIDALLLTEPGLDTESQVLRSFEYNLSGREREIREQVGNRKLQLPSTTPDPGVLARAREILAPHPVWTFRGRKLDTGHPAHFATIGMVAYAAAWAHKTENSEELVERLIRNGVSGSREALSRFATAAIAETIHHGDRMARLSADLSPHEIFIHDRLSWIVRKIPGFDQLDGPRRVTALVQAMRTHRITGSRQAMRAMVETYLGEHVVSAPFPTEPSRTIPLPGNGGMAFVPSIPNTLDGAPKRRRDGTTAADPQDPQTTVKLAGTTAEILQRYGALATSHLVTSIPHEVFPYRTFGKQITLHFEQERKRQADSGTLWSPLYRGRRGYESYDKDELNDLTAWLYRKVVADQTSSPTAIARSAAEAGFTTGTKQLLGAARAAMEAAALDGRRHPYLILGKPEHRVRIVALLDRILVNTDRRAQVQTLASLNDLNVHGHNNLLRALITEREQALKDDPALAEAARRLGLPTLRPSGAFLGRFLDVAKAADRGWIDKLAYAAAWEHKTATADELTRLLRDEGITGDPGLLREIVTTVIGEATRQGDRLPLLDATDQGQHAAIHARTAAIVNATPALYASTGTALVTHMRTRHITGPQHDLETIAQTILETPAEKLTQDYSLTPLDLDYLPSAARAIGAETEPTGYGPDTSPAIEALATTAKQLLLDFGDLNISYLTARWPNPSGKNKPSFKEMSEHLTTERARLLDSGELWLPTYRRLRNSRKDDHTDDLTAWLYRQVVTDRTKSPTAIASSAAAAGFATGYNQLVGAARAAMEAATNDGRRHVYLRIAKPDHRDRIITLIDRILANTPSPTRHQVINSLHEVNVHGDYSVLHGLVSERRQALQDDPALAEAARQLGLPTLRPTGAFRGRFLDTANEADHSWIDSLAYAAAWEHKTATVEHLVTLLTQEGIRDTNGGLTPLVARVLAEADANGDRHTTLSTHRPADHTAILRRTGTLVLKNHHALFPLDPNKATTRLVRHMRRNHITGTQDTLRNIAHTVYTLPTHQPLPGT